MANRRHRRRYRITPEERERRRLRAAELRSEGGKFGPASEPPPSPTFARIAELASEIDQALGQTEDVDDAEAVEPSSSSSRADLERRLRQLADRLAADVERRREVDAQIAAQPVQPPPAEPERVEPETTVDAFEPETSPLHYPSRLIREPQPEPEPEPEDPAAESAARAFASRLPSSGTTWRSGARPGYRYLH